jgi:hypothetical protein
MKKSIHKPSESHVGDASTDIPHLRHEARVALDLAVVALAPSQLVERLATAVGLLESLGDLPADSPPVLALVPKAIALAKGGLDDWRSWHKQHLERRIPSG